jgi:hypothetical protein
MSRDQGVEPPCWAARPPTPTPATPPACPTKGPVGGREPGTRTQDGRAPHRQPTRYGRR